MNKIKKIIELYKKTDSDITDLMVLIEYSDILFTESEQKELSDFYDIEFDKKF